MACCRSAGVRTSFGDSHCPFHGTKHTTTKAQLSALQLNNHHAVTCPNTGLQNTLHKDMVYAVIDVMKQCNIGGPITKEDTRCFNGPKTYTKENPTKYSMDITAPVGAARGATDPNIRDKLLMIDVSVRNPCGDSAITELHSNTVAGAAAARAETDKANTYTGTYSPVTSNLTTAAFETFGRIGTHLKCLLKQFVVHWATALVGDQRTAQMGRKMTRLRETLSVALQKALYRSELRYVQALRVKRVSNVPMFEALWDMSEADMSSAYGTYTVSSLQQAPVVVGGGVRAVVSSLAALVGALSSAEDFIIDTSSRTPRLALLVACGAATYCVHAYYLILCVFTSTLCLHAGRPMDISVRNPCGDSAITVLHCDTVAGVTTAKTETDKADTYTKTFSPLTSTLIAAAFETFGRIGINLKCLLKQFVVH
eukprot:1443-Heterococcus_DN1.PRE.3